MSHPHHILHILIHAARGGCERACEHVCRYLQDARHTVVVLGVRDEMSAVWEGAGATVEHLDIRNLPLFKRLMALSAALSVVSADGVIIWHGMVELPLMLHALPARKVPVLIYGGNPATGLRTWIDWRYFLIEKLLFRSDRDPLYTCCSQYVADSFAGSRYLRRFRRCAVTNGVDPVPAEGAHTPRELSLAYSDVVIGMLARLDAIKDHATLLRAFALVRRSVPHARLEFAGDGDQMAPLMQLAAELNLGEAVKFLGTVQDVYSLLPRWDLFAYATTQNEGFGIALAEALMCGLPSVVTDVGPVREVCGGEAEQAVVYVPPHDPRALASVLVELAGDLQRRQDLSTGARRRAVAELGAEVFAQRYENLLKQERVRLAVHTA